MACSAPASARADDHPLRLGDPEALPYLARQTRLTFARCGVVDPVSAEDYVAHGGYAGLARALALDGTGIVDEIKLSGLRGRGGAGFPTGIKWSTVLLAESDQKYVVCNADEGDSGTFADRMLMEGDPVLADRGNDDRRPRGRGHAGLRLYPVGIPARRPGDEPRHRGRDGGRVSRPVDPRLGPRLHDRDPGRGRGLYLRRGDVAARQPRRQARHGAGQASPARHQGPLRQAYGRQQRAVARDRPLDHGQRRQSLCGVRQGAFPRDAAVPARRQRQAWRTDRDRVRPHAARGGRGLRRRHPVGPAAARRAGGRSPRRLFPRSPARHAARLRSLRGPERPARPRRDRRLRRHGRPRAARPGSPSSSAPRKAAASARPAASARRGVSR